MACTNSRVPREAVQSTYLPHLPWVKAAKVSILRWPKTARGLATQSIRLPTIPSPHRSGVKTRLARRHANVWPCCLATRSRAPEPLACPQETPRAMTVDSIPQANVPSAPPRAIPVLPRQIQTRTTTCQDLQAHPVGQTDQAPLGPNPATYRPIQNRLASVAKEPNGQMPTPWGPPKVSPHLTCGCTTTKMPGRPTRWRRVTTTNAWAQVRRTLQEIRTQLLRAFNAVSNASRSGP
jgi:hypothetical protein